MAGARRATVLVVDDSITVRASVAATLREAGFAVAEAADGRRALAAIADQRPSVVLLDLEMPELDGWGVLEALAAEDALRTLPVLVLTRPTHPGDVVRALKAGALDVLHKPPAEGELLARVRSAARIAASEDALRERNDDLEAFAARASHDLKTPLAVISGMAETLELSWERLREEDRATLLASIGTQARRAAAMVGDLLTLARGQAARDVGATADPRAAIEAARATLELRPGDEVAVEGSWPTVAVAAPDLTSVVGNLLANAHHYGRGDDGELHVRVTGAPAGGVLRITVADGGRGLPDGEADHLFEAFSTGHGSRERNPASSGLGLAIVRRAVERWGGEVAAGPAEGGGASFSVTAPLA